jgi:hypothetical protein
MPFVLPFALAASLATARFAVQAAPPAVAPTAAVPAPSTLKMVERLRECRRLAEAEPEANAFMNRERAALFSKRAQESRGAREAESHLRSATERIMAGDTAGGIAELDLAEAALPKAPADRRAKVTEQIARWKGVGWLRLGEEENCLARHCCSSCIAPIDPGGQHHERRGSERAIAEFTQILARSPKDDEAIWLLNLAHMTLGTWPDGVPPQFLVPPERFASEAALPRWPDVAAACGVDQTSLAGGICIEDFDRDGDLDLITSGMGWDDPLHYFVSDGAGRWVDRAREAGIDVLTGGLNLVHADYDNDGFEDVLVLRGAWLKDMGRIPNSLLRNRGDGTFEDVTEAAGVLSFHPTQTATWADFDGDGWLDLAIGNETTRGGGIHACELYRNRRDGTFVEVGAQVGFGLSAMVKGVIAGDFDDDGRPDLFVSRRNAMNLLLRNEPDPTAGSPGWRFVDVTTVAQTLLPKMSFPCWFFDYDNDGRQDLWCGVNGGFNEGVYDTVGTFMCGRDVGVMEHPRLWRNLGGGKFEDVSAATRIDRSVLVMGSNFGDLDNDGWLDLYLGTGGPDLGSLLPNQAFRNDEGRGFQDVTTAMGTGHLQKGHGVAFGDLDQDGDQDLYCELGGFVTNDAYPSVLFENPGNANRWITLRLEGVKANRSAIGARIRVDLATPRGPRQLHVVCNTGGSFGSQSLQQEIGLGDATAIERIEIRWPGSGTLQTLAGPALDGCYRVREDASECVPVAMKAFKLGGGER